ncbi:Hypothetical protein SCF082_LOCUS4348 [Durusdinium trenchii]|uniref:AB hydrolase-1 domain-containing protein n=1 Tax=Durusdinium trenchii TaxID=1381693 RepID=A0ABP0I1T9_9DINO
MSERRGSPRRMPRWWIAAALAALAAWEGLPQQLLHTRDTQWYVEAPTADWKRDGVRSVFVTANGIRVHLETTAEEGAGEAAVAARQHVLIVPGTGTGAGMFRRWPSKDDSMVAELSKRKGVVVTAVDLRGHGRTTVTPGPYSVELLAEDVAGAMRSAFPGEKFHVYGLSVGMGVAMVLALDHKDVVASISGNGFLFDRSVFQFDAWFFSRPFVTRALGMQLLATAAEMVLDINERGVFVEESRHMPLEGFVQTSLSWLDFNVTHRMHEYEAPMLLLSPDKDAKATGNSKAQFLRETAGCRAKVDIVEFAGFSHFMPFERGGPRRIVEAMVRSHGLGESA